MIPPRLLKESIANAGYVEWEANHHKMGFNAAHRQKDFETIAGSSAGHFFYDHRQCEISSKKPAINRVKELRDAKELKAREGNKFEKYPHPERRRAGGNSPV